MNISYLQHRALTRFWALLTMFAVLLSAFVAPFSVAFAEDNAEVIESVEQTDEAEVATEPTIEPEPEPEVATEQDIVESADETQVSTEPTSEVVQEEAILEATTPIEETFTPQISFFRAFSIDSLEDELLECTDELDGDWSDNVVSTSQAKRKDGSDVLPQRSIAEAALTNMPIEGSTGFYSLGFGGSVTLSFNKYVVNFALGTDLTVIETTNLPYPTETAMVEVSQDGVTWFFAGLAVDAGGNYFDFDSIGLDWIRFVRITDTSNPALFPDDADGFDVSAVIAKQGVCELPQEPTYTITGYKWNDLDADGVWDENEPKLAGWTIVATENEDTANPSQFEDITDETGYYAIEVPAGSWIITEVGQKGWEQTSPSDLGYCTLTVGQESGDARVADAECNFGNHETVLPLCVAGQNLIQNGSFETPNLPGEGFGWDIFESVSNGLVWVVDWLNPTDESPNPAELELQSGYYTASHGVQYAELDSNWNPAPGGPYFGEDARVSIYQDIVTIPGNTYTVSYDFSALPRRGADTNILKVLLDQVEVAQHSADGIGQTDTVWNSFSYSFVATSTQSRIGFADAGIADSFGTLLDNVSVECIPATLEEEEEEEEEIVPTRRSGGGGSGGTLVRPTSMVEGDSISAPSPQPMVLGEQVTAVPYGAPGTGHGGSSQQSALTFGNILFLAVRRTEVN